MRPDSLSSPEDGLGKRLRPCFLKGFSDDHVKRSKKRPIYWLITSPKGTLQALIYLHRYNRDTVNRFLNDYLRPYQQKLEAKRVSAEHVLTGGGSSQSEKTKAQKRIDWRRNFGSPGEIRKGFRTVTGCYMDGMCWTNGLFGNGIKIVNSEEAKRSGRTRTKS
jgi:hypothetical protein